MYALNSGTGEIFVNVSTTTNSATTTSIFAASPTMRPISICNAVTPLRPRNATSAIATLPAVLMPPPTSAETAALRPLTPRATSATASVTPA